MSVAGGFEPSPEGYFPFIYNVKSTYQISGFRTRVLTGVMLPIFLIAAYAAEAQSASGFLYGKVHTRSNTYEGQIRWGSEESFWTDYFNAAKKSSHSYKKIAEQNKKESTSWLDFDWDILSIWENKTTLHQFSCQFGDIKMLEILNSSNVRLYFKNDLEIEVNGDGYNDIGTNIQVLDGEFGWTSLNWDKVEKVEFLQMPKGSAAQNISPIYGTVETNRNEKFTGYIQWDHDERISTDKLDGDSRDGRLAVSFSEVVSIEKRNNGSDVALKSGRKVYLTGTNDVNDENKGVIIIQPGKGMMDIPWESFKSVKFFPAEHSGPGYESFTAPKALSGTVYRFDEKELTGKIIFDIDEALDVETLEGKDNNIKYTIPFRNIKSIKPKNDDYAQVELKNGETLLLGNERDVSEENDGVIIFVKGKKEPIHLRWGKIEQITFD